MLRYNLFRQAIVLAFASWVPIALSGGLRAQDTYEDDGGRFMVDLPNAYILTSQKSSNVFSFKAGLFAKDSGPHIILVFTDGGTDLSAAYKQGISIMGGSLKNPSLLGDVLGMNLNGNPARIGIYQGHVEASGKQVPLFAVMGSAVLKNGSVVFLSFFNASQRTEWELLLKDTFFSIRNVGDPVVGARNIRPQGS